MRSTQPLKTCKSSSPNAFFAGFRKILKPRPRLTGSQWADTFRYVAAGTSPEPGRWRTARVPYLREPLDAATSPGIEKVVIMAASQVAKSELLINVLGYYIDQEPSPILMLQPTVEQAEAFSKERIDPTIQASPALRAKMEPEGKDGRGSSRKSSNTIRMKHFPGGYLALVGSNSPAGLASRPIRVLLCDEIDRYGETKEGDPLKLATQRTANFGNRKIIEVSTPTLTSRTDGPTVYSEYLRTDQREFFVECPHCHGRFIQKWEQVKWEKDENDLPIAESVRLECPLCGQKVRGPGKPLPSLLEGGQWRPTAEHPESAAVGFHVTSLCSPWVALSDLALEFVSAVHARDKAGLQEFLNLKLGEPWAEYQQEAQSWERLGERREAYSRTAFPDAVLFLTAGVDVQRDRLECTVVGWGVGREAWVITHQQLFGDPLAEAVWDQLDALLLRTQWMTVSGQMRRLIAAFVDSGDGVTTSQVYRYTKARERYRIVSVKGKGGLALPFVGIYRRIEEPPRPLLYTLGVDAGKAIVMSRLEIEEPGPGCVHFPVGEMGVDEEYFKQLTAEVQKRVKDKQGRERLMWVKIRDRNEALDCFVYATAAMEAVNPDFEKIQRHIGKR